MLRKMFKQTTGVSKVRTLNIWIIYAYTCIPRYSSPEKCLYYYGRIQYVYNKKQTC